MNIWQNKRGIVLYDIPKKKKKKKKKERKKKSANVCTRRANVFLRSRIRIQFSRAYMLPLPQPNRELLLSATGDALCSSVSLSLGTFTSTQCEGKVCAIISLLSLGTFTSTQCEVKVCAIISLLSMGTFTSTQCEGKLSVISLSRNYIVQNEEKVFASIDKLYTLIPRET